MERGRQKKIKSERAEGARTFFGLRSIKFSDFLLNSALVYAFPRIQNETLKKECIWVRIRGAFLAKKGAPKLSFHCEGGGSCPHLPPLNPPLLEQGREKRCMKINKSQTKILYNIHARRASQNSGIIIDGEELDSVEQYVYLVQLSSRLQSVERNSKTNRTGMGKLWKI